MKQTTQLDESSDKPLTYSEYREAERAKEEREEKQLHVYAMSLGFVFCGTFLSMLLTQRRDDEAWTYITNLASGGLLSVALGWGAYALYSAFAKEQTRRISIFIFALFLALIIPVSIGSYLRRNAEFKCCECGVAVSKEENIQYHGGNTLCSNCLCEGLLNGSLGYCESCRAVFRSEDMRGGLCADCNANFIESLYTSQK